jgi:hypothetical protein
VSIVVHPGPDAVTLDRIEASAPRLVRREVVTGEYIVVVGPKPPPDAAWHARQAGLYRDAAEREQGSKDGDRLRLLAELHDGRAAR